MKRVFKNLIGYGTWMAALVVAATVTILPAATADKTDDIVEDLAKAKEVGERIDATCETTTTNLDKRGKLVYVAESGGKLYVTDQHGHGLVVLGADGRFIGRELEMGWVSGRVYYPAQLCVSGEGLVFVADRGNNRIQIFSESR